jgi:acyl-CoA synthetase (AMP-forming)/AMP-acid ligase II
MADNYVDPPVASASAGRASAVNLDVTSLHHRRAVHRWERMSVGDLMERVTWSRPDKLAITGRPGAFGDQQFAALSYRQADELANQVAHALLARGLQRGDVVLLFCENSVEAYLSKLGIAKAGLVAAPLNPMMAPDLVAAMIDLVEPGLAIVDAELWPQAAGPFASRGLAPAVVIEIGGAAADVAAAAGPQAAGLAEAATAAVVSFSDFSAGQPVTEPEVEIHADDIWEILFTSGTTALPKGVMISHACSYSAGFGFALSLTRGLRLESDLTLGTYLPMIYHVGDQPFTYSVFLSGGTLVLGRRPHPAQIAEMIADEKVTALWAGSPAMVRALDAELTARPDLDASSLTVLVYGWAALPPATLASLKQHCGEDLCAFEIFGQTECIPCHRFWPGEWPELYAATAPQLNYVGIPSPILASTVFDPDGHDLRSAPGTAGEAVYRSPAVMAGYYKDKPATEHAFRFGWFHSGDSCAYDDDGLRIMVDRYKDIVKTGGENVSSLRVEAVLAQHPGVAKSAVIGLPHEHWGEAVTAVVVLRDGAGVSADDLVRHCRASLAGYESPKSVIFADDLPETVGGKVLKYRLRAAHSGHYGGDGA